MLRNIKLDFVGNRKKWYAASIAVIALGLLFTLLPGQGLRMGIDFTGGLYVDMRFDEGAPPVNEVREILEDLGLQQSVVQRSTENIIIRTPPIDAQGRDALLGQMREQWPGFELMQLEEVQPIIGQELGGRALLSLAAALLGMILYITYRFEFKFAIAAIVALFHDALVTISILAILGAEINSHFVAAVLLIVGYSVNDTIVVFDRIRENVRERTKEPLPGVVNDSIKQMLSRSVNTSMTTLLAIGSILVFGGRTIQDFALALALGVMAGTYSSIFIASPFWTGWKLSEARGRGASGKKATAR